MSRTWNDWSDDELSSKMMTVKYGEQVEYWCLSECGKYVYDCGPFGDQFYKADIIDINSWSDMGPLMVENGISITKISTGFVHEYVAHTGYWHHGNFIDDDDFEHSEPPRERTTRSSHSIPNDEWSERK